MDFNTNLDIGTEGVGAVFCVGFIVVETTKNNKRKRDLGKLFLKNISTRIKG